MNISLISLCLWTTEFSLRLIEVTDNRNDFSCKGLLANISERRIVEHASTLVLHLIDKVYIAPTT